MMQVTWADEVLVSSDTDAMAKEVGEFDFILNTIPVDTKSTPTSIFSKWMAPCVLGAVEP